MVRTHGRSHAARRDPTQGGDSFPEILFDADAPSEEAIHTIRDGAPWVLEIGTGNGVYLADLAQRKPERRYLGVERDAEFFFKMKKRLIRHGIQNARCIRGEIEDVLDRLIPDGGLEEAILNFSDPWPKRRHRTRRVFNPAFLRRMEQKLMPGAPLRFKTDVGWYFNLAMTDVRKQPGWNVRRAGPVSGAGPGREEEPDGGGGRVETNFERKGRAQGRVIWAFEVYHGSVAQERS